MGQALLDWLSLTGVWIGGLGLSAFLALFWVLRGAPIGQAVGVEEHEDAPRGGYRDRVIAAVSVGMVLIGLGAYLAASRGVAWSLPAFALGFGTVFTLVRINERYRHGSPTLRRTVGLASTVLNASLLAGVLVVLNVVAFRYGGRALDLTSEGAYSLSSLTRAQVGTLARPVTFTTFFGRSAAAAQQFDRVQQLLELYRAANPARVRLDHVDPFRDLGRYEELVKRVPDIDVTQGGGVLVEYGEGATPDRLVVRNADLFETPAAARFDPDAERYESSFKGEDALTSALMRLREAKKPKVVFVVGHGEPSLDDAAADSGLGRWRGRLVATGIDVVPVNLLIDQEIPEDAAVVIVAGPKTPFKPEEAVRLKAFLDRGRPLLALLGDVESTGLEGVLTPFGVEAGRGFVVEPRLNYNSPQLVVAPVVQSTHPVLESLNGQVLLLPRPAPLRLAGGPGSETKQAPAEFVLTPLLRTSPQAWLEADLGTRRLQKDGGDESGPFTVAVAVNDRGPAGDPKPGPPRAVVFGCRYLGDNGVVLRDPTDLDLLMNTVNWLRGRSAESTGIAPKTHVSLTLTADPLLRARLILVPTVMSVLLIVSFGVATYLARRD